MRASPHVHPCARCQVETECSGTLEANPDGWPEVVCVEFDIEGLEVLCEDCAELADRCDEPGDPDGEAFRGGEAAAYEREQMDEARKLK